MNSKVAFFILFSSQVLVGCTGSTRQSTPPSTEPSPEPEDLRAYMHGIEAVKNDDGSYWVMFSSAGMPPAGPNQNGSWPHDVYRAKWSAGDVNLQTASNFISAPEAQEPASIARTQNGNIMVTFEDGIAASNVLAQRYGVYDAALNAVKAYPNDVLDGGHSGHVAATDNHFVVFYSEDWVLGGGVDNLGTGNGVYATVYNSSGDRTHTDAVQVAPNAREWWPMLAASHQKVLLIWQRYVPGELYADLIMAVLDPATNQLTTTPTTLKTGIRYYVYQAVYVEAVDRFLVTGTTYDGTGFANLVDTSGHITATLTGLPTIVREGGIAVENNLAYLAAGTNELIQLSLTSTSITLQATKTSPISWSYIGNLGLVRGPSKVHWVSLSRDGLQEADFDFN